MKGTAGVKAETGATPSAGGSGTDEAIRNAVGDLDMTLHIWELNPHLALMRSESAALAPCKGEQWLNRLEAVLGHSLDGDLEKDGYSLDHCVDLYDDGWSVQDAAEYIREMKLDV